MHRNVERLTIFGHWHKDHFSPAFSTLKLAAL